MKSMSNRSPVEELSEKELELLQRFLGQSQYNIHKTVTEILTQDDDLDVTGTNAVDILPFISSLDAVDIQIFALGQAKGETKRKLNQISWHDEEIPADATVTPEKLSRLLIKDEITTYFLTAGMLIEQFSVEVLMEVLVDESRKSGGVRDDLERKSQSELRWLLHVTGAIDDGLKGEMKRVYNLRSSLAHGSARKSIIEELDDIESEVDRSYRVVNKLYEEAYGKTMEMRISEIMMD